MAPEHIQPITRPGGWTLEGGYRRRAHMCLDLLEVKTSNWWKQYGKAFEAKRSPVPTEAFDALNEIHLLSDSTVVFAAMAVESFLNVYGVVRLGEAFYARHYERLNIGSKLAAILATCCSTLITADDEISQVVNRLFERRNALVHPKTREAKRGRRHQSPKLQPPRDLARSVIQDMERFIELFRAFDTDAGRWEHA